MVSYVPDSETNGPEKRLCFCGRERPDGSSKADEEIRGDDSVIVVRKNGQILDARLNDMYQPFLFSERIKEKLVV